MKKKFLFIFLIVLFSLAGFSPVEAKRTMNLAIGKGEAVVSSLEGPAEMLEDGEKTWKPLKIREALREGDEVRTGKGARMELLLPDKSQARFAENSAFKVVRMQVEGQSQPRDVKIHLALGKAWSNVVRAVGSKGNFEISCDKAVAGVRGTIYRMDVEEDRSALVRVYDGIVHVTGGGKAMEKSMPVGPPTRVAGPKPIPGPHKVTMEEWTIIVKAMQQVRIGADGAAEKPRDFTMEEDRNEWVDWNRTKDEGK